MVDLPDHSVLIGGLEMWEGVDKPVFEERLTTKLATIFNVPSIRLFEPPIDPRDPLAARSGITAWKFPEWFIGQYEDSRLSVGRRPFDDLQRERKKARVFAALEGLTDEAILEEIQRRKGGVTGSGKKIKQSETEMLLSSPDEIGEDVPGDDFYARAFPFAKREGDSPKHQAMRTGAPILSSIDRVVLVHRLREVMVQLGFTRFESAVPDIDGALALDVRRASLAREISWLPAVENRGEGIFIALKSDRIREWAAQASVQTRGRQLMEGFRA